MKDVLDILNVDQNSRLDFLISSYSKFADITLNSFPFYAYDEVLIQEFFQGLIPVKMSKGTDFQIKSGFSLWQDHISSMLKSKKKSKNYILIPETFESESMETLPQIKSQSVVFSVKSSLKLEQNVFETLEDVTLFVYKSERLNSVLENAREVKKKNVLSFFPELVSEEHIPRLLSYLLLKTIPILRNHRNLLFSQTLPSRFVYMILSGEVEILTLENFPIRKFSSGCIVGELACLFNKSNNSFIAKVSSSEALLYQIPKGVYGGILKDFKLESSTQKVATLKYFGKIITSDEGIATEIERRTSTLVQIKKSLLNLPKVEQKKITIEESYSPKMSTVNRLFPPYSDAKLHLIKSLQKIENQPIQNTIRGDMISPSSISHKSKPSHSTVQFSVLFPRINTIFERSPHRPTFL